MTLHNTHQNRSWVLHQKANRHIDVCFDCFPLKIYQDHIFVDLDKILDPCVMHVRESLSVEKSQFQNIFKSAKHIEPNSSIVFLKSERKVKI